MNLYPRSFWTASIPKLNSWGDDPVGLSFWTFDESPEIEFVLPNREIIFSQRNPREELQTLMKEQVSHSALSDIDYNYAITQNTEGVYTLRGACSKCSRSEKLRVLLLLGNKEQPTDLLKQNQEDFLNAWPNLGAKPPGARLTLGETNIHVFDLIEYLRESRLFEGRNNAVYGDMVKHAVMKLQARLGAPELDGEYGLWLVSRLSRSLSRV